MKAYTQVLKTAFLITGNLIGQTFTRITTGAIVNEGNSYGMAWGDYDGDDQFTRVLSAGELVNGGGPGAGSVWGEGQLGHGSCHGQLPSLAAQ